MAVFLRLDGIEGESTDSRHAGEIDVGSWSFGVTNPDPGHLGGGGGVGRATFSDLTVVKQLDRATPALLRNAAAGTHVASAQLSVTTEGEAPRDLLTVGLEDVLVTGVLLSGAEGRPTENVSLAFRTLRVTYQAQRPDGSLEPVPLGWDVANGHPV